MAQKVEPGLDNFGMRERYLNSLLQLLLDPRLPFLRGHAGGEHGHADAVARENAFQAARHVPLLRINRIDVAVTACSELRLDNLEQAALLGLETLPIQILGSTNQKLFPPASLLIELPTPQLTDLVGPVRVH